MYKMAVSWKPHGDKAVGMVADRTLCLDKTATRLVPEGSAESAFQLVNAGREIPEDEVARLGLVVVSGRVEQPHAQADGDAGPVAGEPASEPAPESPGDSEG
jgi:hypothetical protein